MKPTRLRTKLLAATLILLISVVLAEVLVRLMGFAPARIPEFEILNEPDSCILAHPQLGYSLNDGDYSVTLNRGLTYSVHQQEGRRSTQNSTQLPADTLSEMALMGCSFTYGMGVNDHETFAYRVNQHFDSIQVNNYGVPGYGTLQPYLQLKEMIHSGRAPRYVVYCYLDFHNERNALNPAYQEVVWSGWWATQKTIEKKKVDECAFPYGEQVGDELLVRHLPFPDFQQIGFFRRVSALVNLSFLTVRQFQEVRDEELITREAIALVAGIVYGRRDSILHCLFKSP